MAHSQRRSRSTLRPPKRSTYRYRPRSKRKRDFQTTIYYLTVGSMIVLVVGFFLSAITTRSGVQVTAEAVGMLAVSGENEKVAPAESVPAEFDSDRTSEVPADRIEIEILNGCGVTGLAGRYTELLRRQGFDVINFTNAQRNDYARTIVINRGVDYPSALKVAHALGLDVNAVENVPDPSLHLDVTIILGADYYTLPSYGQLRSARR